MVKGFLKTNLKSNQSSPNDTPNVFGPNQINISGGYMEEKAAPSNDNAPATSTGSTGKTTNTFLYSSVPECYLCAPV